MKTIGRDISECCFYRDDSFPVDGTNTGLSSCAWLKTSGNYTIASSILSCDNSFRVQEADNRGSCSTRSRVLKLDVNFATSAWLLVEFCRTNPGVSPQKYVGIRFRHGVENLGDTIPCYIVELVDSNTVIKRYNINGQLGNPLADPFGYSPPLYFYYDEENSVLGFKTDHRAGPFPYEPGNVGFHVPVDSSYGHLCAWGAYTGSGTIAFGAVSVGTLITPPSVGYVSSYTNPRLCSTVSWQDEWCDPEHSCGATLLGHTGGYIGSGTASTFTASWAFNGFTSATTFGPQTTDATGGPVTGGCGTTAEMYPTTAGGPIKPEAYRYFAVKGCGTITLSCRVTGAKYYLSTDGAMTPYGAPTNYMSIERICPIGSGAPIAELAADYSGLQGSCASGYCDTETATAGTSLSNLPLGIYKLVMRGPPQVPMWNDPLLTCTVGFVRTMPGYTAQFIIGGSSSDIALLDGACP